MNNIYYPFTAIVGQERMKRALILNAIDPRIGGALIRGERGSAKSTAARGLAALLPEIKVNQGCHFNCDPSDKSSWCTECLQRTAKGEKIATTRRKTPFVNLPVSATEDRIAGTLDIEKAIQSGQRAFEPGILALANRGILYIDEVNLLEDHAVDALLDSAAMGVNIVEREGISFSHPARFILIGTMNPEEGDLRPQLLDRFAHSVDIYSLPDARDRVEIMKRRIAFDQNPAKFIREWKQEETALSKKIIAAKKSLSTVSYTSRDLITIASLTADLKVEGHRADLVILKSAIAQAAFEGRKRITALDIAMAAEIALPHRTQKGPFSEKDISAEELQMKIDALKGAESNGVFTPASNDDLEDAEKKI